MSDTNQVYLLNRPDIFPPNIPLYSINFTSVGSFSCTPLKTNKKMVDMIQEYSNSFNNNEIKFFDGTACVGSDVINTLYNWPFKEKLFIIANELDPLNFLCLKENIDLFKYNNRTQLYNTDTINLLTKLSDDIQIMYFDPPWGGHDYKQKNKLDLFLGKVNVFDLVKILFESRKRLLLVILKLPFNYNDNSEGYLYLVRNFDIKKITDKNIVYLFFTIKKQVQLQKKDSNNWTVIEYIANRDNEIPQTKKLTNKPIAMPKFNRLYFYTNNQTILVQKIIEFCIKQHSNIKISFSPTESYIIVDIQSDELLKYIDNNIKIFSEYLSGLPKELKDDNIIINKLGITAFFPVQNFIVTSKYNLYLQ